VSGDDLVKFEIPASFVLERMFPSAAELAWGFRRGWVSAEGVVAIALGKLIAGIYLPGPEEELALLLSDDLDRVAELVADLEFVDEPDERRARVWLFLALSWLLVRRHEFADPHEMIEMLYADFDSPAEIRDLVRYMQPEPGQPIGLSALDERWRAWIETVGWEYRDRQLMLTETEQADDL